MHLNWGGLTDVEKKKKARSKKVNREKSAEAIVVKKPCESKEERRAEQL